MFLALAATVVIVKDAYQQAQLIVDRIVSGEIPLEAGPVSELAANSSAGSDSMLSSVALFIFIACWLIGIIDSYRVGVALEKQR